MSDLSPDEKGILAEHLKAVQADRFSLSPRIKRMRSILDKLQPPALQARAATDDEAARRPSMVVPRVRGTKLGRVVKS
jgi:hypothetical protein